jgi:hypothetical protein
MGGGVSASTAVFLIVSLKAPLPTSFPLSQYLIGARSSYPLETQSASFFLSLSFSFSLSFFLSLLFSLSRVESAVLFGLSISDSLTVVVVRVAVSAPTPPSIVIPIVWKHANDTLEPGTTMCANQADALTRALTAARLRVMADGCEVESALELGERKLLDKWLYDNVDTVKMRSRYLHFDIEFRDKREVHSGGDSAVVEGGVCVCVCPSAWPMRE